MKNRFTKIAAVLAISAVGAQADIITLDFEGIGDNVQIGDFYNGVGGPDYNISFGPNALSLEFGNFGNNPSGVGILYFLDGSAVMNVPDGFTDGFSFFYASLNSATVNVYSGLNDTGDLLGSFTIEGTPNPYYVWAPVGVAFQGVAHSVDFVGAPDYVGFDNITFGSSVPEGAESPVPEPTTVVGGIVLAGLVGGRALRRKKA